MKLTSTNKPTTCHTTHTPHQGRCGTKNVRVHYAVPEIRTGHRRAHHARRSRSHLHRVSAAIATGKRPAPFRTRKLSPSAPMVLPGGPGGRVGRRLASFVDGGQPRTGQSS